MERSKRCSLGHRQKKKEQNSHLCLFLYFKKGISFMLLSIKAELCPHLGPCQGHGEGPLEARMGASDALWAWVPSRPQGPDRAALLALQQPGSRMSKQGGICPRKLPMSGRHFPQPLKWGLGHPEPRGHSGLLREWASEEEHHPARRAVPGAPGLWGATNQPHS